ncbi:hypothetical protein DFH09DRAFT_1083597 [Mycena vulgaris]|nr:hypothetical protein DFH09DRAFT_1083597 [Mycena vulgaris]
MPRLTYLYSNLPHLRETMPRDWQTEPSWLPAWIDPPNTLKVAFPEKRPAIVYYTPEGERRTREMSPLSSWKAPADFVAPAMEYPPPRSKPFKKVSISDTVHGQGEDAPTEWKQLPPSSRSVFGSSTPFKSAEEFFLVPKSRIGLAPSLRVPNAPNPLDGLAAPASYGYGGTESISQAHCPSKDAGTGNRFSNQTGDTPVRQSVSTDSGQYQKDTEEFYRDVPPHMVRSERAGNSSSKQMDHADGSGPSRSGGGQDRPPRGATLQMSRLMMMTIVETEAPTEGLRELLRLEEMDEGIPAIFLIGEKEGAHLEEDHLLTIHLKRQTSSREIGLTGQLRFTAP